MIFNLIFFFIWRRIGQCFAGYVILQCV